MKTVIASGLLILGILFAAYEWELFKLHECLKVGHSLLYCIVN